MGKMNWGRIIFGGIVAGVVWTLLSMVITVTVSRDFAAAVPGGMPRLLHPPAGFATYMFAVNLAMGIWAIWLYAAIRPRFGPGPKTAAIAGLAWYFITGCGDAIWMGFGFVPPHAIIGPTLGSIPAMILATLAGAWLYRESARPPSQAHPIQVVN